MFTNYKKIKIHRIYVRKNIYIDLLTEICSGPDCSVCLCVSACVCARVYVCVVMLCILVSCDQGHGDLLNKVCVNEDDKLCSDSHFFFVLILLYIVRLLFKIT